MPIDPLHAAQLTAGVLGAAVGLGSLAGVVRTILALPVLGEQPVPSRDDWPPLSVLIPACDEADTLPDTLQALLSIDYPDLQVVVVDDRSADQTPAVLARLAEADERLAAVRVDHLPAGWLGKVHALHRGMAEVRGDWVLLMDADVVLSPGCLRRAVAFAESGGLSLISAHPEIRSGGLLVDAVFNAVALSLGAARYWQVADPDRPTAISVGAFILVRRADFLRTEGFPWLRLEVADDMALSLLLKRAGHRIALLNGRGQIVLTWYRSFAEMQRRMQKNWFAIMGRCSVPRCLALALFLALFPLLPLSQLPDAGVAPGVRLALLAVGMGGMSLAGLLWAHATRRPLPTAAIPWLGNLLMAWMLVRSAVIGARIGGIEWRGRVYDAQTLHAGRRVFF